MADYSTDHIRCMNPTSMMMGHETQYTQQDGHREQHPADQGNSPERTRALGNAGDTNDPAASGLGARSAARALAPSSPMLYSVENNGRD